MALLSPSLVRLGAAPATKEQAISDAGSMLLAAGYIDAGYVRSLLAREEVANTYLGNGVAIPHGMVQHRALVKRTGVAILQVPAGVVWNEGQVAKLVVAIAAQSDEHIDVLKRLTRLMGDEDALRRIIDARDPQEVVAALGDGAAPRAAEPAAPAEDFPEAFAIALEYPTGLHARPATRWVDTAKRFGSEIRVRAGVESASAKSLVALLQLGIRAGQLLHVSARGPDASAALDALRRIIVSLVPEEQAQARAAEQAAKAAASGWTPRASPISIPGVGASPGLAIGAVRQHRARRLDPTDAPRGPEVDGALLDAALEAVAAELEVLSVETGKRVGAAEAGIFRAQRELIRDPALVRSTAVHVVSGHGAAWAWRQALDEHAQGLRSVPNPLLAARAADLIDAGERVLRRLMGIDGDALEVDAPSILLAEDLSPSDTATLDPELVLGLCTAHGGPTSHMAILARTLGVPAIVAAGGALLEVEDGTPVILDGLLGRLYVQPSREDIESARRWQADEAERRRHEAELRAQPAVTADGHRVEVAANANRPDQAAAALDAGAEGVGLMRTEFLFLERASAPDEEEQAAIYRAMVDVMAGRPIVIRTLDVGGDKQVPYLDLPREQNPFLGIRGARLCLRRPDLFEPQLRALYRAARHGPLSIMFPMVTTIEEVEQLRGLAERVRAQLGAPRVPLGIMVEVPSVAVMAEQFAEHVDFFSIGTNDLTQYTLAVDREHPELAAMANSLHPAVLRLIERTVAGARVHGKWVGVCGGLAGDPLGAVILVGLGVDELSMSARDIPAVKARLRSVTLVAAREIALRALGCETVAEVRALEAAVDGAGTEHEAGSLPGAFPGALPGALH
ncbi:phosphoenolpyruvate--protein phosphotransferase [Anaeromyxobacter oryzae]|uniref:phosphoenolpyruvate--protein phosphotransferase n=1 Tax=Anaeromyxobacter oryzae TaxID=2918170 RepID=A0ABM7WPQ1_9BACT|nr:phosphoenolpyruvate--protein phosphotransferase [Anaeromyxobacter oryzae]BDG01449.1 phosphoenolpyruvate--protein phosphotransferase [Anaeromyxobacter oryzae]